MSEVLRQHIKRDVPPAAHIKFRCARVNKNSDTDYTESRQSTIYDVLRARGYKEVEDSEDDWTLNWTDREWIYVRIFCKNQFTYSFFLMSNAF